MATLTADALAQLAYLVRNLSTALIRGFDAQPEGPVPRWQHEAMDVVGRVQLTGLLSRDGGEITLPEREVLEGFVRDLVTALQSWYDAPSDAETYQWRDGVPELLFLARGTWMNFRVPRHQLVREVTDLLRNAGQGPAVALLLEHYGVSS